MEYKNLGNIKLCNCTTHDITLYTDNNSPILTIPKSGTVLRVPFIPDIEKEHIFTTDIGIDIPVFETELEDSLPPEQEGLFYIVSNIYASYIGWMLRNDILTPHRTIRNGNNQVIGCHCFRRMKRLNVKFSNSNEL